MRIEALNQAAQAYKVSKPSRAKETKEAGEIKRTGNQDELRISSFGRDFQVAKQAVAEASDIREDKIAPIKERINSGNYNVDADAFAEKLLQKYNTFML